MMNDAFKHIALFLLWICTSGLFAGGPNFHLVGIDVQGARWVSESLVTSESALKLDRAYTEPELQAALSRVTRLPFILSAEFSLRKGDRYGTYVLVIQVVETKPYFVQYARFMEDHHAQDPWGNTQRFSVEENELNVGGRLFLGKSSQIYLVAVLENRQRSRDSPPPFGLGYSHYNLFKRRIFFSFNFIYDKDQRDQFQDFFGSVTEAFDPDTFDPDAFDPERSTAEDAAGTDLTVSSSLVEEYWSPSLNLSIPLRDQHWLVAELDYAETRFNYSNTFSTEPTDRIREKRLELNLGWSHNTLNDLVIPTTGARAEAGIRVLELKSIFDLVIDPQILDELEAADDNPFGTTLPSEVRLFSNAHSRTTNTFLTLGLTRYRALNRRVSLFIDGEADLRLSASGDETRDPVKAHWELATGVVLNPFSFKPFNHGDVRLELSMGREEERQDGPRYTTNYVHLGLPLRNAWGLIRLSFRYLDETAAPRLFQHE